MGWWRTAPRWVVLTTVAIAVVFLGVGTVTHVTDFLSGGLMSHPWAPRWLNLYWTSLAIADTTAGVLLLAGRRRGIELAMAIMVTDLLANAYAAVVVRNEELLAEPGMVRIAAFTAVVLVIGPLVRPHLRSGYWLYHCARERSVSRE